MSDAERPPALSAGRDPVAGELDEAREVLAIARQIAAEAAEFLRGSAGNVGRIDSKSTPQDLVTEWDRKTEDLIRERLQQLTPDVPMLGEERGSWAADASDSDVADDGRSRDRWLIDPIDGTVNFAHGLPFFAVSIALERGGRPLAGVVAAPALGWEFHACRGGGAYLGDQRLAVSTTDALIQALLASGFPYDRATNPDNNFRHWEHFLRRAGACRRLGAASLDLCLVARGNLDGYWERHLNPWDIGAGLLLVEEAGGRVSDFRGDPVALEVGEVLASNGAIHDAMLAELRQLAATAESPSASAHNS
ncbi:MAG: inositol monophosphatase family protein [Haliangiales bacterium]